MSSDCEGRTQEDIGKDIEEWRARAGLTQLQLVFKFDDILMRAIEKYQKGEKEA